ncbi:hypothetical protein ACGFSB_18360 [Streptomyces sp. NPDC048441]|uniref:hypothetical protein n=1 Tax=Streptomyces sp. NPDC048441 TaxID=3365552 RepID=UPI0037206377
MRLKRTLPTLAAATAVTVAGLVGLSATPAAAAGVDFDYGRNSQAAGIDAWKDSRMLGNTTWQIDGLSDGSKGDTLCVIDNKKDGRWLVATTSKGHKVSTRYAHGRVKCMTKNVAEGKRLTMKLAVSGGGTSKAYKTHG